MRAYILAAAAAALLVIPTYAFSQEIQIGPGGVKVGPGYHSHRYYNRYEGGGMSPIESRLHAQGRTRRARHGELPQIWELCG